MTLIDFFLEYTKDLCIITIKKKMGQPSCEHSRVLWVFHEELSRMPVECWKQHGRASTWPEDKVPQCKVSSNPFGADKIGAVGGAIPIRCMRSTSPRREAVMCANNWAAIRLLLLDLALLPWWGGNQWWLPYDSYLIKKPYEASSGLTWCGRLVANLDFGLIHSRRRGLHQLLCRWLMREDTHHRSRIRKPWGGSRRDRAGDGEGEAGAGEVEGGREAGEVDTADADADGSMG